MQIAIFHLFFNCATALITTPLIKLLVKFSEFVIKDKENKDTIIEKLIDNVDDISDLVRSEESINPVNGNKDKYENKLENDEDKEKKINLGGNENNCEENKVKDTDL